MPINYVREEDHRDAGGVLNWVEFRAAQMLNGEYCQRCGALMYQPHGKRVTCESCVHFIDSSGAVSHGRWIRCPACARQVDPHDGYPDVFEEGDHDIRCVECDHEYTVCTAVHYIFTSPPKEAL